jgi:hypothetical protein
MFASLHAARQAQARRSIVALGKLVVPKYDRRLHWYHVQIAEALEGLLRFVRYKGERGGYARVVISMPPRHGKSLHATELLPAMALGVDPDLKIMVATNGASLAKDGVKNTREWMNSALYKQTFATRVGKVESIDDNTGRRQGVVEVTDAALMFNTLKPKHAGSQEYVPAKGYYLAQGLGGSLTGKGFDIGIMDDLVKNAEQAMSPTTNPKVWAFYASTFATRANHQHAGQLYIGTRWTEPDFVDELCDFWRSQETAGLHLPIKVLRFPAIAEDPLEPDDPRQIGEGLDKGPPDGIYSLAHYEGTRNALLATQPWVWHGLYQQRPNALGQKFFQPDDWATYNGSFDLAKQLDYLDFSIDTNLSDSGQSYACIHVFGVLRTPDGGQYFFLLDESRGHYSLGQIEDEMQRLGKKWKAALPKQFRAGQWWVEAKALGQTVIKKYAGTYPIIAVGKVRSKLYCYRVASVVTGQQRVWVPSESFGRDPTNPALPLVDHSFVGSMEQQGSWVHEQGSYPSKPDDRRDTLAMQIICRTPWLGPDVLAKQ